VDYFISLYYASGLTLIKIFPLSLIQKAYNSLFSDSKELSKYIKSITGISPSKIKLYKQVFKHRSSFGDSKDNNERLELLGDSVLDLVVVEYLFKKYPYKEEGFITEMKSKIVNRSSLNAVGQKLGLVDKLSWNKKSSGDTPKDIAGNTFEALIGAIYLDVGLDSAKKFIFKRVLQSLIDVDVLEATETDYKSKIFHYIQKNGKKLEFLTASEQSKNKRTYFVIHLMIDNELVAIGEGFSKKNAEQVAAMKALSMVKVG
jgi:ribonuclease-3